MCQRGLPLLLRCQESEQFSICKTLQKKKTTKQQNNKEKKTSKKLKKTKKQQQQNNKSNQLKIRQVACLPS